MIDKTQYAIVHVGPLTASGEDEIVARFVLKKDAEWAIRQRTNMTPAKARRNGVEIVRLDGFEQPRRGRP